MVTLLNRYDEFNAANINSRLAELDAQYERSKNPFVLIQAGSISTNTETIDIPVTFAEYSLLRLRTGLVFTLAGFESPVVIVNNYRDTAYKNAYLQVSSGIATAFSHDSFPPGRAVSTPVVAGFPMMIDAWMVPTSEGFSLLGFIAGSHVSGGLGVRRNGVSFAAGAVTSLQISFQDGSGVVGAGSYYSAGTYYLEGMPA